MIIGQQVQKINIGVGLWLVGFIKECIQTNEE